MRTALSSVVTIRIDRYTPAQVIFTAVMLLHLLLMPKELIFTSHSKAIIHLRDTTQRSRLPDITPTRKSG